MPFIVSVSYLSGMIVDFLATWRGANPFQKPVP